MERGQRSQSCHVWLIQILLENEELTRQIFVDGIFVLVVFSHLNNKTNITMLCCATLSPFVDYFCILSRQLVMETF